MICILISQMKPLLMRRIDADGSGFGRFPPQTGAPSLDIAADLRPRLVHEENPTSDDEATPEAAGPEVKQFRPHQLKIRLRG